MNKLALITVAAVVLFFIFSSTDQMPTEALEVHNQDEYSSLSNMAGGRCSSEKCLTIYVAPWCPACKKLNPMILSLREELLAENIDVTIIVGQDSIKKTKDYADKYKFPVLLDPKGKFFTKADQRGVPFFIASNLKGEITAKISGGHSSVAVMRKELEL